MLTLSQTYLMMSEEEEYKSAGGLIANVSSAIKKGPSFDLSFLCFNTSGDTERLKLTFPANS